MNYQLIIDYTIGSWGYSKQYVRNVLSGYKGKHVDVKISSPGGELDHGLDIRQQFLDHGDVTVYLSGFVASAATVIAMGASRVVMSKYAMFLVHKCSNFIDAWGAYNADEMQQLINELTENKRENDKIDVVLANMYAAKCKKKVSEILDLLKAGRWMTAEEALEYGFIDEISEFDGESKLNMTPDLKRRFNAIGLTTDGLEDVMVNKAARKGLLSKIVEAVFPPKEDKTDENQSKEMAKKEFKNIGTATKQDANFEISEDGNVTIPENSMQAIDSHIASQASQIADRDAKITELENKIKDLEEAPADDTTDVKDDGSEAGSFTASQLFNSIKSAL